MPYFHNLEEETTLTTHSVFVTVSFSAGLHRRTSVQGFMSRGGRFGGAAGQVEPPRREKCFTARGRNTEGHCDSGLAVYVLVCIFLYVQDKYDSNPPSGSSLTSLIT